jgi:hypothetical protein
MKGTVKWHYGEVMSAQGLTSTDGRSISAVNINKHHNKKKKLRGF